MTSFILWVGYKIVLMIRAISNVPQIMRYVRTGVKKVLRSIIGVSSSTVEQTMQWVQAEERTEVVAGFRRRYYDL